MHRVDGIEREEQEQQLQNVWICINTMIGLTIRAHNPNSLRIEDLRHALFPTHV